jgi:hypothetical protein
LNHAHIRAAYNENLTMEVAMPNDKPGQQSQNPSQKPGQQGQNPNQKPGQQTQNPGQGGKPGDKK